MTLLYNPQTTHRHHWPDTVLCQVRPGAIAQCDLCQQHGEMRLVMFDHGEAMVWVEISGAEAVSKIPLPVEKEISSETERLQRRVETLESVLRAVKHDRPSAHSDRVWDMIIAALDPC